MRLVNYKSQIILLTILSGVICGYVLGVIAMLMPNLVHQQYLLKEQISLLAGALLLGCFISSIFSGSLTDYLGRKKVIILTMLIYIVGIIYFALAHNYYHLYTARLIQGLAYGMCEIVMPLYLVEASETTWRGQIITAFKMANTAGALVASLIWLVISIKFYPLAFAVILLIPIWLLVELRHFPESPRWLVSKNQLAEALRVLNLINPATSAQVMLEIQQASHGRCGRVSDLFKRANLMPFLVVLAAVSLNQLSGINVFVQNSLQIMQNSGISSDSVGIFGNIGISLVNFVCMLMTLLLVEKIGRKKILIIGTSGLLATLLMLFMLHALLAPGEVIAYVTLAGILLVVGFFAFGPGALILVISSELLPTQIRGVAISVAFTIGALVGTLFVSWFGVLSRDLGYARLFLLMAGFISCYWLISIFIPETCGKSLEKIAWKKSD